MFKSAFRVFNRKFTSGTSVGAGGLYLSQDLTDFFSLKEELESWPQSMDDQGSVIEADEKNILIFGRQSPGYVRDEQRENKAGISRSINSSPLFFKSLGTYLDNEKHYQLFDGSDFEVEFFSNASTKIVVKPERMLNFDLDTITDEQIFEVGFARKQGFVDLSRKSPFYHSSIALRVVGSDHQASKDKVLMTGREIRRVITETNNKICASQHCTLYSSNCYSASIYAMGLMIKIIDERSEHTFSQLPQRNDKKDSIAKIAQSLSRAALDNFGRGVSNNEVVKVLLLSDLHPILAKHQLIEEASSLKKNGYK
ncbi:Uncharacterised protein (plasmid) [Legionella adelaidensis]|uniref:Uncharacterized protein n=1 Tax=Legionella adelaidensis TaxID=45056 RepID=A0A0W0R1T1_9GAMM|nr:hypothetical protein [Legionella adelaidensis]KTC65044.1 hypothetical protein Lade_1567 [Legionella adelaidensis]VEH85437.1 Uncharacterised protein [Legionella adelaidensis]